ncbi:MAG: hypothetical protein HDQ91_01605, partial [Desulfovibrio sp.]|nr:hypothetical protein [Desulfovibrio sp.]
MVKHKQETGMGAKEELDAKIARVRAAQEKFATFDQKKVDEIFQHAAAVATSKRIELAKMAA